jgi:hypothetical protein
MHLTLFEVLSLHLQSLVNRSKLGGVFGVRKEGVGGLFFVPDWYFKKSTGEMTVAEKVGAAVTDTMSEFKRFEIHVE